MYDEFELECQGKPVMLRVDDWRVELVGYDHEVDEAAIALGLEPSDCFLLWEGSLYGSSPKNSLELALIKAAEIGRVELVDLIWNKVLQQVVAEWHDEFASVYDALNRAAANGHIAVIRKLLGGGLSIEGGEAEDAVWHAAQAGQQAALDEFRRWHARFVPRENWPQELL